MTDETRYNAYQYKQAKQWEQRCLSCGMCCGVKDNDACTELVQQDNGRYACRIYDKRFGLRQTHSGRYFLCVPIREILNRSWPGHEHCAYKQT